MLADRNRLTCPLEQIPQPPPQPITQPARRPVCVNTCEENANECVIEMDSRGFVVFHAHEAGAKASSGGRDQIRMSFRINNLRDQDQDLVSIYHPEKTLRIFLSNGHPMIDLNGLTTTNVGSMATYNDGKWHRLVLEQKGREVRNRNFRKKN